MSKRYEFLLKEYKSDDRQKCPALSNSQIMRQIISLLKHLKKARRNNLNKHSKENDNGSNAQHKRGNPKQGCPWVRFVPNLDLTQIFRVGEKKNQNRPVIMVKSSSSGPSGFEFHCRCRYFSKLIEIWPIFFWIRRIWTRSRQISR